MGSFSKMFFLLLLLSASCLAAPPSQARTHVHKDDSCVRARCRVSANTLDSALKTFLCMKEDDIKEVFGHQHEKEKKVVLAKKIAPYLKIDGVASVEDALSKMDTARPVPLVNLILHDQGVVETVQPKTELEYIRALREGLSSYTSLQPALFRRANPIVLGLLNCRAKLLEEIHRQVAQPESSQRNARMFGDGMTEDLAEIPRTIKALLQFELDWLKNKIGNNSDS